MFGFQVNRVPCTLKVMDFSYQRATAHLDEGKSRCIKTPYRSGSQAHQTMKIFMGPRLVTSIDRERGWTEEMIPYFPMGPVQEDRLDVTAPEQCAVRSLISGTAYSIDPRIPDICR